MQWRNDTMMMLVMVQSDVCSSVSHFLWKSIHSYSVILLKDRQTNKQQNQSHYVFAWGLKSEYNRAGTSGSQSVVKSSPCCRRQEPYKRVSWLSLTNRKRIHTDPLNDVLQESNNYLLYISKNAALSTVVPSCCIYCRGLTFVLLWRLDMTRATSLIAQCQLHNLSVLNSRHSQLNEIWHTSSKLGYAAL